MTVFGKWGMRTAFFLFFCFLLVFLMVAPAGNGARLAPLIQRFARAQAAIMGEAAQGAVAASLSGYLAGSRASAAPEGEGTPLFSDRELRHLRDVRGLMRLSDALLCASAALSVACVLLFIRSRLKRGMRFALDILRAAIFSECAALLAGAALGVWAALDFSGAFLWLHKVAFRNDLWLLDPSRDMLIMLMPEPFFTRYALLAARDAGIVLLGLLAALLLARRCCGRRAMEGVV